LLFIAWVWFYLISITYLFGYVYYVLACDAAFKCSQPGFELNLSLRKPIRSHWPTL